MTKYNFHSGSVKATSPVKSDEPSKDKELELKQLAKRRFTEHFSLARLLNSKPQDLTIDELINFEVDLQIDKLIDNQLEDLLSGEESPESLGPNTRGWRLATVINWEAKHV